MTNQFILDGIQTNVIKSSPLKQNNILLSSFFLINFCSVMIYFYSDIFQIEMSDKCCGNKKESICCIIKETKSRLAYLIFFYEFIFMLLLSIYPGEIYPFRYFFFIIFSWSRLYFTSKYINSITPWMIVIISTFSFFFIRKYFISIH